MDEATGRRSSRHHLCAPWAKPEGRSLSGGDTCLSSLQLPAATRALPRPTENSSQRTREPLAPQRPDSNCLHGLDIWDRYIL